jgi:dipeptidyl aminopeptidase/acylaminoacyl peptidase
MKRFIAPMLAMLVLTAAACHDTTTPDPVPLPPPPVASVTVTADRRLFEPGDTEPLRAIVADATGHPLEGRAIIWTSSDTSVATVGAAGVVTAREAGLVAVTATSEGRSGSVRLAVSDPPSADLLYHRANGIFVLGTRPGSIPTRVHASLVARRPAAATDGDRIAFAASMISPTGEAIDDIFIIDRIGTAPRRLTTAEGWDDMPAWSPILESRLIAYVHRDAVTPRDDIWVVRDDGTGARNLTADLPAELMRGEPAWSPDGQWIAFTQSNTSPAGRGGGLWVMRANGSSKRQLTTNPGGGFDLHPSWSPDGQHIVFARDGLAIVTVVTGVVVRLTLPGIASAPAWSPDGRHIAFAWQGTEPGLGAWDIYTVHPDGSDMRRRASNVAQLGNTVEPSWIGGIP